MKMYICEGGCELACVRAREREKKWESKFPNVHCCYLMTVAVAQVTKCLSAESKDLGSNPVGKFEFFEFHQFHRSFKIPIKFGT